MVTLLIMLIFILGVKTIFNPYIDVTRNGDWILWYNIKAKRKHITLWTNQK